MLGTLERTLTKAVADAQGDGHHSDTADDFCSEEGQYGKDAGIPK